MVTKPISYEIDTKDWLNSKILQVGEKFFGSFRVLYLVRKQAKKLSPQKK